jgi:hypothetical protein
MYLIVGQICSSVLFWGALNRRLSAWCHRGYVWSNKLKEPKTFFSEHGLRWAVPWSSSPSDRPPKKNLLKLQSLRQPLPMANYQRKKKLSWRSIQNPLGTFNRIAKLNKKPKIKVSWQSSVYQGHDFQGPVINLPTYILNKCMLPGMWSHFVAFEKSDDVDVDQITSPGHGTVSKLWRRSGYPGPIYVKTCGNIVVAIEMSTPLGWLHRRDRVNTRFFSHPAVWPFRWGLQLFVYQHFVYQNFVEQHFAYQHFFYQTFFLPTIHLPKFCQATFRVPIFFSTNNSSTKILSNNI